MVLDLDAPLGSAKIGFWFRNLSVGIECVASKNVSAACPVAHMVPRRFDMISEGDLASQRQYVATSDRLVMSATHPFGHGSLRAFEEGTGEAALIQAAPCIRPYTFRHTCLYARAWHTRGYMSGHIRSRSSCTTGPMSFPCLGKCL